LSLSIKVVTQYEKGVLFRLGRITGVELGVQNITVVFPAPMMSAIRDLGNFFACETTAAHEIPPTPGVAASVPSRPPTPALADDAKSDAAPAAG
jgi:hypothetical protein